MEKHCLLILLKISFLSSMKHSLNVFKLDVALCILPSILKSCFFKNHKWTVRQKELVLLNRQN